MTRLHQCLFASLLFLGITAHPLAGEVSTHTAIYEVSVDNAPVGTMTRTLKHDGTRMRYVSDTKATQGFYQMLGISIEESSEWEGDAKQTRALHYRYRQGGMGARESTVQFDWARKVASFKHKKKTGEIPVSAEVVDRLLLHYALMRDVAGGRQTLEYQVFDGNKIKPFRFEKVAQEKLNTPLGEVAAIHLEYRKDNSERNTQIWLAPEWGHVPVKLVHTEKDGSRTRMLIQKLSLN